MKTTIDIPEAVLEAAMKFTGAKTKREAVVGAVEDWKLAPQQINILPTLAPESQARELRFPQNTPRRWDFAA